MCPSSRPKSAWFVAAVIAAVSLFSTGVFAKPVAKEDAATAVSGWLKHPGRGLNAAIGNMVKETEVFTDATGAPTYYVVYLDPSGFVIVPADDLVEPILCFSPEGKYVASDENPLGALVMRDIPGRLALARAQQPAGAPQARLQDAQRKWDKFRAAAAAQPGTSLMSPPDSVSDVRVDPLTQSLWSQGSASNGYCYNYYTPNHYPTGCVATAMVQLMRFYQYPTTGIGTGSFSITVDGVSQTASLRGGNGSGGPYDWANMALNPASGATDVQRQAIGALCYDAGVSVNMQYSASGSGASPITASAALKNVFLYSNSICGGTGSNIGSGLTIMLNPNLDAGFPCLLAIYSLSVGHEVVADGYGYDSSTLYHHLNMGWSGSYNAWYNLPSFSTGARNWNPVAWCIYNVYVTGGGEVISGRVLDASNYPVSGATVQAVRAGGGTWTTSTNAKGIYAFAKIPSASTYTLSATAPSLSYADLTAVTGTSTDFNAASGNVWGEDFTVSTTLRVQSTPMTGIVITSSTGHGGTTNYVVPGVALGTSVSLQAPATDPTGYAFSQWTVNGAAQTSGQKVITFTMTAGTAAVARYTLNPCTITVQSTPSMGLSIGSTTGHGGTTNYGLPGVAPGTNVNLQAPAADPAGYTFAQWTLNGVAQAAGQKVLAFSAPNSFAQWGCPGTGNGQFNGPWGIAIDRAGNVYAADTWNDRIQKFTSDGTYITQWGSPGCGNGQFRTPVGVAIDSAGYVYVLEDCGARVQKFTSDGAYITQWRYGLSCPFGIAIDSADNVYVLDNSNRVLKFTSSGAYVTQWGSLGSGNGQFRYPYGIAVDGAGNVYVADTGNNRIQKFTAGGTYVTQWGGAGSGNGQLNAPHGIALDAAGYVYVADSSNNRIQKFTSDGTYVTQWGSLGSGNGQFHGPQGIAVDGLGNVYVADTDNNRVQKFTSNGTYVTQWGSYGSGNGQLHAPYGIAVDGAGNVYVADTGNNRVLKFTSNGAYVTQWGSCGSGNGQFGGPVGVAVDGVGNIYVLDCGNNRVQAFRQSILAVAEYTLMSSDTLAVQSTPPTGLSIGSSTGHGGTTNYTKTGVASGTSINLQAPATDPTGYTFSRWTVNGTAQTDGQKALNLTMDSAKTAVAEYNPTSSTTTTQPSTTTTTCITTTTTLPPTSTTTYTTTTTTLPPTTTTTYITTTTTLPPTTTTTYITTTTTLPPTTTTTYTTTTTTSTTSTTTTTLPIVRTLDVTSTPITSVAITSTSGHGGTTNYQKTVNNGRTVNLTAPATKAVSGTDYGFVQWSGTPGGTTLSNGGRTISFPIGADTTVTAEYQIVQRTLSVQSSPMTGLTITSTTGHGGETNYQMMVDDNTTVTLTAPPEAGGKYFSCWQTSTGTLLTSNPTLTRTMNANLTAVALYGDIKVLAPSDEGIAIGLGQTYSVRFTGTLPLKAKVKITLYNGAGEHWDLAPAAKNSGVWLWKKVGTWKSKT